MLPQVRGISGGQVKRVNVGLELVAEPSLLFLVRHDPNAASAIFDPLGGLIKHAACSHAVCEVLNQPSVIILTVTVYHAQLRKVTTLLVRAGQAATAPHNMFDMDMCVAV